MDEFDKIRELSEDLSNRREPVFTSFAKQPEPTEQPVLNHQQTYFEPSVEPTIAPSFTPSEGQAFNFSTQDEINFIPLETQIDEKSFPSMKMHIVFISILSAIFILALIGFFAFNAEKDDSEEITTITASPDVIKEAPEQAGGLVIPDQDKLVYNRIRTDNVTTKVESLFPEPEKPVLPQILAIEQNAPEETFVGMNEVKGVDPLNEQNAPQAKPDALAKEEKTVVTQEIEKPVLPVENKVTTPIVVDDKPKKEVITLTPFAPKETTQKLKETGIWRVQLFASNNRQAVDKAWARIQTQHVKMISNMSYLIKKVDIPGKGSFYRLQVGQFPNREMAEALCSKLKAQKQDCIPTK